MALALRLLDRRDEARAALQRIDETYSASHPQDAARARRALEIMDEEDANPIPAISNQPAGNVQPLDSRHPE